MNDTETIIATTEPRSAYDQAMGIPAKPSKPAPPEEPSKNGRPFHAPTEERRACVLLMAGMGAGQNDIASRLRIGIHTLRRDYAEELAAGKAEMDAEAYAALRRGIQKDDAALIKYYLDRRVPAFKPDANESGVNVNVSFTIDDILKSIDGKTKALPKFTRDQFITVEHKDGENTEVTSDIPAAGSEIPGV